jgi:hypothetical protein
MFEGRVMAEAAIRRPFTAEDRVEPQSSACGIYVGGIGTEKGFPTSASVFPSQYHSTSALYSLNN